MLDIATGAVAGLAAGEAGEALHTSPTGKSSEVHLLEISECLRELCNHITHMPDYEPDVWTIRNLTNAAPWSTNFKFAKQEYRTLHILVGTACTLLVTVNGLSPISLVFASAPAAGQLQLGIPFRWRYPPGTLLSLSLPILSGGSFFPIAILYSNETGI